MPGLANTDEAAEVRGFMRRLFDDVLARVNVADAMRASFAVDDKVLGVGDSTLDLSLFDRALLAAMGKAAVPMVEHAFAALRSALPVRGVAVGAAAWSGPAEIQYFEGGHPVPDERSCVAADALLRLLRTADARTLVVFLISGGASSMAEAPLGSRVPAEELFAFYRRLLHSGLPIDRLNALRKHLSAVKGGRMALACGEATRCTVLVSDVPPGRLNVIGSGPSLPDDSTIAECRQILAETPSLLPLTPALQDFFDAMPETPKVLPEGRAPSIQYAALSSDSLIRAAERIACAAGYFVVIDNLCDDWDYRDAVRYLFDRALREAERHARVCVLSAGEVTVSISGHAGRGGRNQQWALEFARQIRGRGGIVAMSAGSDGIDGNSSAAGAIVDGSTWERIERNGDDPQEALEGFDAYPVLSAVGDAIICGPTNNNLRDLRVILIG